MGAYKTQIKSGTVSEKAGKFYVAVLTDEEAEKENEALNDAGIGIDVEVKELAVVSNGQVFENKSKTLKELSDIKVIIGEAKITNASTCFRKPIINLLTDSS